MFRDAHNPACTLPNATSNTTADTTMPTTYTECFRAPSRYAREAVLCDRTPTARVCVADAVRADADRCSIWGWVWGEKGEGRSRTDGALGRA